MNPRSPPDLWVRTDRLFQRILDLPHEERARLLAEARAVDPEAAHEVEALLAAQRDGRDFLEEPIGGLFDLDEALRASREEPSERVPLTRAGPYRLLCRVGRGGTASVYLAERDDGQWKQRVAVKILHRGLDTDRVVERFRAERQILSSLDHPNVARFLGGGSTEDGRPFLVMEYVDGTPIVEHCDVLGLGIRARVELFLHVAGALQAAHQRLVVHRDVKPSNVLVDAQGRVKLLDFGIAKLLEPSWDGETTRLVHRALTPSYASPEQVRGEAITTASDVYQMGILLCELLCGRRPYEVTGLSPAAIERAVTHADPTPPSALVSQDTARARSAGAEQLRRELSGDLDSIVLKALRKAPEERYPSAAALADDLRRHLGGFPVIARADSVGYRARKFVRRHRVGVTVGAGAVLLLGGAVIFSMGQARQAALERDRAQEAQARAERVTDFVTRLLQVADPNVVGADALSARPILDAGVNLARTQLEGDPAALADVLGTIGALYSTLGFGSQAGRVLEEAVDLRRSGETDPAALSHDLRQLAWVRAWVDKRVPEAERLYREAASTAREALGPRSPEFAGALVGLADLPLGEVAGLSGPERRRSLADSALTILRGLPAEDVPEELADALYVSATIPGSGDRVVPELEEALVLRRGFFGSDNLGIAVVLNDLALALEATDPVASDTLMAQALELHSRLLGERHATTLTILNNRAGLLRDQGRFEEAEPLYRRVLRIRQESLPEDAVPIAYSLHGLGWVLAETGRAEEAEPLLREMLRILESEGDSPADARYRVGLSTLGRALSLMGRYDDATPLLESGWRWATEEVPGSPWEQLFGERLADHYRASGRPDEAARIRGSTSGS